MPKIGYGSNKATKFCRPDGFKTFLVKNVADLDMLLMHNRTYAAEVAHNVSSRVRGLILNRAAELDVKVTNAAARVRTEETK
jgi:large subunit ribosomal protein L32e